MATGNRRSTTVRQSFVRSHPTLLALDSGEGLACVGGQATRPGS